MSVIFNSAQNPLPESLERMRQAPLFVGGIYAHPEIQFVFVITNITKEFGGKVRGLWYTKKGVKVSSVHDSISIQEFKKNMILISKD